MQVLIIERVEVVQAKHSTTIGLRNNLSTVHCAKIVSTENIQSEWSEPRTSHSLSQSAGLNASRSLPWLAGGPQTAAS